MERERGCDPLILANTAVVVSLEVSHTAVLVERALLEIYSGSVNVRRYYADAVCNTFASDGENEKVLAAVVVVELVAYRNLVSKSVLLKALCREHLNRDLYSLALCLSGVKKALVALCISKSRLGSLLAELLVNCFLGVKNVLVHYEFSSFL